MRALETGAVKPVPYTKWAWRVEVSIDENSESDKGSGNLPANFRTGEMLTQIMQECVKVWDDTLRSERERLQVQAIKHNIQSDLVRRLWNEIEED